MHLGVNIDHVATLRQARKGVEPEPIAAAVIAEFAGADGITVHLREDRRHIQDRDLRLLRGIVRIELNLEMAATQEMFDIAMRIRPDLVTIVPEKREELTTEGGLEVLMNREYLQIYIKNIRDSGIPVSLFINPDIEQIKASQAIGADMVEIHTGIYANAKTSIERQTEFERVRESCRFASKLGFLVNAGHGLNYQNVSLIAGIKELRGLYIGHSIVSRAVFVGFERAVREMKQLIMAGRQ
ncbi:MAG: pyridoxine 5'-phosphate synthase [Nitrospirota bacterium]